MKSNFFYYLFIISNVLFLLFATGLSLYYGLSVFFEIGVNKPFYFWNEAFVHITILTGAWIAFDLFMLIWFMIKYPEV